MASADTTEASTAGAVARLLGMVVNEVSLVDAAANKRQFLIVKRDAMKKTLKKDEAAAPGTEAAPTGEAPAAAGPTAMQAQVKDALLQALTGAAEKIVSLADAVKDVEVSDAEQTPAVPEAILASVAEAASMLGAIVEQYGGAPAAAEAPGADAEKAAEGAPIDPAAAAAPVQTDVAKAGRRMAKERLDRFRKAFDLLAGIMRELHSELGKAKAPVAKSATPAPATVSIPAAAAAEIVSAVGDLSAIVESQAREIETLRKNIGAPASMPIEKGASGGGKPPEPTSWPLDMNRPITKSTTKPAMSFYGGR